MTPCRKWLDKRNPSVRGRCLGNGKDLLIIAPMGKVDKDQRKCI
jgi:hypothetical protein